MLNKMNYRKTDIPSGKFDMCGGCRTELGRSYVTGNKRETYKDQDGKSRRRILPIKIMYCSEACCEGDNAEVSDTFSF